MTGGIHQDKLYINIYDYEDPAYPFQIFIGGRGLGKTYSALKGQLLRQDGRRFILMRRTADEMDLLLDSAGGEGANPFKVLNRDLGLNVGMRSINDKLAGIYDRSEKEEGGYLYEGAPRGYGVALSTIAKIRGIDFSDSDDMIYDEFIPEKHIKRMRNEADALLNAYETVNRNREFDGRPPLRLWMLSNANNIYNPIFVGLGIVALVERMVRKGKSDIYIPERGLAIHLLQASTSFQEKKSRTAIARLTAGTSYYDMAYGNDFAYNDFSGVGWRKLTGYRPICAIGKATMYAKKGDSDIYVSYSPARCEKYDPAVESDVLRFRREFGLGLREKYVEGNLSFESYELKEILLNIIL